MVLEQLRQKHFSLKELFFWLTLVCIVFGILRRPIADTCSSPNAITLVKAIFLPETYFLNLEPTTEEWKLLEEEAKTNSAFFVISVTLLLFSFIVHIFFLPMFIFHIIPIFYRKYIKNE